MIFIDKPLDVSVLKNVKSMASGNFLTQLNCAYKYIHADPDASIVGWGYEMEAWICTIRQQ